MSEESLGSSGRSGDIRERWPKGRCSRHRLFDDAKSATFVELSYPTGDGGKLTGCHCLG